MLEEALAVLRPLAFRHGPLRHDQVREVRRIRQSIGVLVMHHDSRTVQTAGFQVPSRLLHASSIPLDAEDLQSRSRGDFGG
jgi:hypothetical protein